MSQVTRWDDMCFETCRSMSGEADLRVGILAPLHLALGKNHAQDRDLHMPLGGVICPKMPEYNMPIYVNSTA